MPALSRFSSYQIPQFPEINSFTWQPDNQIKLNIAKEIKLELQFQETPNNELFWGRLEVQKVKLVNNPTK